MASKLDQELLNVFHFLKSHPTVRQRLCAPPGKTVVYSGRISVGKDVYKAYQVLADLKAQNPQRYDYVTLEERLRQFHVVEFGETLFEHANRVKDSLVSRGLDDQAVCLWRALSGIYIQGAMGKVRALIFPHDKIGQSVFSLTEAKVLMQPHVLQKIQLNPELIRDFQMKVKTSMSPSNIIVF